MGHNTFSNLITGTVTEPPTVYQPEGVFFLADEGGTYTNQDASGNTFVGYSGDGIDESAGYQGGYVIPGCIANGSITTALTNNNFELTGGNQGDAVNLLAIGNGNSLTGTVNKDHGYVTSPNTGIQVQSQAAVPGNPPSCSPYQQVTPGGATVNLAENNDNITTHTSGGPAAHGGLHALHLPHHSRKP